MENIVQNKEILVSVKSHKSESINHSLLSEYSINLINYPKSNNKYSGNPEDYINARVELTDFTGVIKYCGKLQHTKNNKKADDGEIWLGIMWDDHTRGKHNGKVEGNYFL